MKKIMKLWLIMGGVVIIAVVAVGLLYLSTLNQNNRGNQLKAEHSQALLLLDQSNKEKQTLAGEITLLEGQVVDAEESIAEIGFTSSAESIEYDAILFGMADNYDLNVMNIGTSDPRKATKTQNQKGQPDYWFTTFIISMKCGMPGSLFNTGTDSVLYIDASVNNILGFVNTLVTSNNFKTVVINSVSINSPEPKTDGQIVELRNTIMNDIENGLTAEETEGKTEEEIRQLVLEKLAAKTTEEIKLFYDMQGLETPSANIVFEILTYEG